MENEIGAEPLLTTGEALKELHARGLRIDRGTLIRWARAGRIPSEPMPSGRRRYRRRDVLALVPGHSTTDPDPEPAAA